MQPVNHICDTYEINYPGKEDIDGMKEYYHALIHGQIDRQDYFKFARSLVTETKLDMKKDRIMKGINNYEEHGVKSAYMNDALETMAYHLIYHPYPLNNINTNYWKAIESICSFLRYGSKQDSSKIQKSEELLELSQTLVTMQLNAKKVNEERVKGVVSEEEQFNGIRQMLQGLSGN